MEVERERAHIPIAGISLPGISRKSLSMHLQDQIDTNRYFIVSKGVQYREIDKIDCRGRFPREANLTFDVAPYCRTEVEQDPAIKTFNLDV